MEYNRVVVVEPGTIVNRGPAGLRKLYVALTVVLSSLTVLHASPLSEALTNTDNNTEPLPTEAQPGPAEGDIPEIGTDIRVRVVGHTTGGNYKVEAISPATDHPLVLVVRHGSTPPHVGAELNGWVFRHACNVSFVTLDERGRKPISPKMARRYADAVSIPNELAGGDIPQDARIRLSELKGMANRCLRLDQPDWLDVWRVLGSPDKARLNVLRELAANTNRELASSAPDLVKVQAHLERSGWADALSEAWQTLKHRLAVTDEPVTKRENTATVPQQPELKDSDSMSTTTADTVAAKTESISPLLHVLETSTAADRTCNMHEAVRFELMAVLLRAGLQPISSQVIDVSCVTKDGHFLYEVLGSGRSSYADLRLGAVHLLEVNHTLPTSADRLCLVLSEPPAEDWSAETIHDVFGVHLLWRTADGWGGQDTKTALVCGQV